MIASTPYYAVIFSSKRTPGDQGYNQMAERMVELAASQPGFLGIENARDDSLGITVSYWESEEAIAAWKANAEHTLAQQKGRDLWYESFSLKVCLVKREYDFKKHSTNN